MPITVTLEGEEEAIVSRLVDAALFPSALETVEAAVRRLGQEAQTAPGPGDQDDGSASR